MMFREMIEIKAYGIFYVPVPITQGSTHFRRGLRNFWVGSSILGPKTYTRYDVLPIRIHIRRSGYVSTQFAPVGLDVMQWHKAA